MEMASGAQAIQRRHAIVLVACMVLIWGCNWPINKVILTYISPLWFACIRMAVGAVSLFLVQAFRSGGIRLPARVRSAHRAQRWPGANGGHAGIDESRLGQRSGWALCHSLLHDAALGGSGSHPDPRRAAALGQGDGTAAGTAPASPSCSIRCGFDWSDRKAIIGNGYLLAAAVLWAATTVHVRAHRWRGTPLALAPWQMLVGLIPMLALARWIEGPAPDVGFSVDAVLLALYSGPVITAFPFWAFVTIARTLPALTTSLTLLLVPVVGLLSSAAFLAEPLDATTVVGLLLIVGAVAAVSLADAKEAR